MSAVSTDQIHGALEKIRVPKLDKSIVELDVIQDVAIDAGNVSLTLKFNIPAYASKTQLHDWVVDAVSAVPGVQMVQATFTSNAGKPDTAANHTASPSRMIQLSQVGCVVAVFSGKGGVGKSTVSANLAVALTLLGESVGLFDADLHGPSLPTIMGVSDRPKMEGQKMSPINRHGVKTMSVGMLVEKDEPLIWRGPMITKGINELLETTEWGALDFLILDLPPGTGDAQLGLAQDVRLDGSIAVTTPQNVALADVHRGIAAFKKLEVPIWGVIENMGYFVCPNCDAEHEIFGSGGGKAESEQHNIPLLGRLAIDPKVCESGDAGTPMLSQHPQHPVSLEFKRIATHVLEIATQ